jgi:hypothetical protein
LENNLLQRAYLPANAQGKKTADVTVIEFQVLMARHTPARRFDLKGCGARGYHGVRTSEAAKRSLPRTT